MTPSQRTLLLMRRYRKVLLIQYPNREGMPKGDFRSRLSALLPS
jgi:hypothetical protein